MIGTWRDQICPRCTNARSSHAPRCGYESTSEAQDLKVVGVVEALRWLGVTLTDWQHRVLKAMSAAWLS